VVQPRRPESGTANVTRKLNGRQIGDSDQFTAMITNLNPGAAVAVDTLRDGQPMIVNAILGMRPDAFGSPLVNSGCPIAFH
jgi:hypothetical protein